MSLVIDGKVYEVPGTYGSFDVVNLGNTSIPAFNGLLLIGNARQGISYNASGKSGSEVITAFNSLKKAKEFFGVCDITKAFEEAKRGGAGTCYFITPAPLTQASATILDGAGSGIFDIKPVVYGAVGNDVYVDFSIAGGKLAIELIPTKLTKFLKEDLDLTGKKSFAVDNVEGLRIGQTVKVEDNGVTTNYVTAKIVNVDSVNNVVTLDTTIVSVTQADYARLFIQDINNKKSTSFDAASGSLLSDAMSWINQSGIIEAVRTASHTGDIATLATTQDFLGKVTSATLGTSPEATTTVGGDFDLLADSLAQKVEEFTNFTKARIRLFTVVSSVSTVHTKYLTLAQTLRSQQSSIQVISGVAKGDISLADSDAAHPINRAKALNSDDFILAGMGYEGKEPVLSLAPYVAGIMSSQTPRHNLTEDTIAVSNVEKFFGEANKETETVSFVKSGVLIIGTGKNGFYLVHGYNTYQDHTNLWNESDEKGYLIQQRQSADYFYEIYYVGMQTSVGGNTTLNGAKAKGLQIIEGAVKRGDIKEGRIADAYKEANSIVTVPEIKLPDATDFIGFIVRILN